MISLKKYLDQNSTGSAESSEAEGSGLLGATISAYRSALLEMGSCSLNACPALGEELKRNLSTLGGELSPASTVENIEAVMQTVQGKLRDWGRRATRHYEQKANEVKEILLAMARTAESVGERDQRFANGFSSVTDKLHRIANLEDLTQIRASIEESAAQLKASVDRMTAEGKAATEKLRMEVSSYQARLEAAEHVASLDSLTGLRNRYWVENYIERKLAEGASFCVLIIDVDGFKQVNDDHGHLAGDELLKLLATELKSVCRTMDVVGRWGGDEFIMLIEGGMQEAGKQTIRLREWVCGNYTVNGRSGPKKLRIDASIGVAERRPKEPMKDLLARADADMYRDKARSRRGEASPRR